jgi:PRTRC genetic system protein B
VNPVRADKRGPRIGPGRPLSRDGIAEALRQLSGQTAARVIPPPHVLFADGGRMLWYRPSARRPIFFHTGRGEFDAALKNAQPLYPALLFLALPRQLFVWALASDARPGPEAPLYRAPFLNVYEGGSLCHGTFKLPAQVTGDVKVWEKGFFETTFTHSNVHTITRHPGGHDGLWRALAERKLKLAWPEWLVPLQAPKTAQAALNLEVRG